MMWVGAVQPGEFAQVRVHFIVVTSGSLAPVVVSEQKVVAIQERPLQLELERLITVGLVALECLKDPAILRIWSEERLGRNPLPVAVLTRENTGRQVIIERIIHLNVHGSPVRVPDSRIRCVD